MIFEGTKRRRGISLPDSLTLVCSLFISSNSSLTPKSPKSHRRTQHGSSKTAKNNLGEIARETNPQPKSAEGQPLEEVELQSAPNHKQIRKREHSYKQQKQDCKTRNSVCIFEPTWDSPFAPEAPPKSRKYNNLQQTSFS